MANSEGYTTSTRLLQTAAGSVGSEPQTADAQRHAVDHPGQVQQPHGPVADRGQVITLNESRYGDTLSEWLGLDANYRVALAAVALGDVGALVRGAATIAYLRSLGPVEREALDALASHEGYQRGVLDALADQWPEVLAGAPGELRQRRQA